MFRSQYSTVFDGDETWKSLPTLLPEIFMNGMMDSTYIQNPPFFKNFSLDVSDPVDINGAYALALLGDSITTDHISHRLVRFLRTALQVDT